MAIAFVARSEAGAGSGTTIVIPSRTYSSGSAIAVWAIWEDVNVSISSVAQSSGSNTWLKAPPAATPANGVQGQWCYAENITGFTGTITVTIGGSSGFNRGVSLEYTGIATSSSLDQSNTASVTGTAFSSGSITTTNADDLLLFGGGLFGSKTCTFGSNWTNRDTDSSETIKYAERVVAATGTYSVTGTGADGITWSVTESSVGSIIALKAAAGGGGGSIGGPVFDGRTFRGLTFGRVLGAPMSREARMMAEADRFWQRDRQLRRAA
jgi:hypothetical protein